MLGNENAWKSNGKFGRLAARCYESPVVTTWASLFFKFSSHAIILPLALNKLSVAELNLWLLLYSFSALGMLLDFGFSATFIRFVAYSQEVASGEDSDALHSSQHQFGGFKIDKIVGAMVFVYDRLLLACVIFLAVFGSAAIANPIAQVSDISSAWIAWVATIVGTTLTLKNSMYAAFLQGSKKIALYRRWESVTGICAIAVALICLSLSSSLLYLVLALQVAPVLGVAIFRRLVSRFEFFRLLRSGIIKSYREPVITYVWDAAWRSGLGVAATMGSINGSNVLLAQILPARVLAPYLLAQRIIAATVAFAGPQFNTAIPHFVRLFKGGNTSDLISQAGNRFKRTNWSLAIALALLALVGPYVLDRLGSETRFVSMEIWIVLSVSAILERSGAMHIQLYSLTNIIVWHIANGVTGLIILIALYPAFVFAGLLGVALVVAAAYGLFYLPYCMSHSYRQYALSPLTFDVTGSLLPILFMVLLGQFAIFLGN